MNGIKQLKIGKAIQMQQSVEDNYVIYFIWPSLLR